MGGKGERRREKNYRAAHGGSATTLPPPPDLFKLDALPSKLRKLMAFTSPSPSLHDSSKGNHQTESSRRDSGRDKRSSPKDEKSSREVGDDDGRPASSEPAEETFQDATDKKKRKKRKRGQVDDLRFQSLVQETSRRKERRKNRQKEYREAKKNKHTKANNNKENDDMHKHEKVRFGDVVLAPPKLAAIPKGLKTPQDVSKERIRLQAVEAYRSRKGWASRPGSRLPPLADTLLQS